MAVLSQLICARCTPALRRLPRRAVGRARVRERTAGGNKLGEPQISKGV